MSAADVAPRRPVLLANVARVVSWPLSALGLAAGTGAKSGGNRTDRNPR